MRRAAEIRCAGPDRSRETPRPLAIFAAWRLQAYGHTIAAIYVASMVFAWQYGIWPVSLEGVPVYRDFTCTYTAGLLALHGETALAYVPSEFLKAQDAIVGSGNSLYEFWPYPPSLFLILAPLALLPYLVAYLTWELATLLGYVAVVYLITRRSASIAVMLASPFIMWNILSGQNGFLTASLIGAALLALERRPVLAGVFIGLLTVKPHWGILLPVILVASRQWRAFGSATVTAGLLAGISILAFGIGPWEAFPREIIAQAGANLSYNPDVLHLRYDPKEGWGFYQTIFGLIRALHGGAALAWLAQGFATCAVAIIVWLVWRSPARYPLKAAALSAAVLLATPYGFAIDLTVLAISVAFLAVDQMQFGLRRGEQWVLLAGFAVCFTLLFKTLPIGPVLMIALLAMILRRAICDRRQLPGAGREPIPPSPDQVRYA